jgi:hypothetical protein
MINRLKKPIILIPSLFITILIITMIIFKIYIKYTFPEKDLKNFISQFIMENFNKAIKFDDIYVNLMGNLILTNLNISNSNDFNDNISFIKSEDAKIKLSMGSLFNNKIKVKGINFDNSEITIYKKFSKNYLDSFKEIFSL